jgi:hypothetical protein
MRLWSLHPSYLDTKGLLALWREALLAQAVLRGRTTGYKNHPQLRRFRDHPTPRKAIALYLWHVYLAAKERGFSFQARKIGTRTSVRPIPVSAGQIEFEARHLLKKLKRRDPSKLQTLRRQKRFRPHPLFKRHPGGVESWERT